MHRAPLSGRRSMASVDQMLRAGVVRVGRSLGSLGAIKQLQSDSNRIILIFGASRALADERKNRSSVP